MKNHPSALLAALALASAAAGALHAAEKPDKIAAIHFGNSFCENSVPWFHPTLSASVGKEMKVNTAFGPGWQLWMHLDEYLKNPKGARSNLTNPEFGTLILHLYGAHPHTNIRK